MPFALAAKIFNNLNYLAPNGNAKLLNNTKTHRNPSKSQGPPHQCHPTIRCPSRSQKVPCHLHLIFTVLLENSRCKHDAGCEIYIYITNIYIYYILYQIWFVCLFPHHAAIIWIPRIFKQSGYYFLHKSCSTPVAMYRLLPSSTYVKSRELQRLHEASPKLHVRQSLGSGEK